MSPSIQKWCFVASLQIEIEITDEQLRSARAEGGRFYIQLNNKKKGK
jgi:hypothetical protein